MRRDGIRKRARNIVLGEHQYELLQLLAEASPYGSPTVSSIVRTAIQEFLDTQRATNETFRKIAERSEQRTRLVPISGGKPGKGGV